MFKQRKRKSLSIFALCMAIVVLLSACGGSNNGAATGNNGGASQSGNDQTANLTDHAPVTLRLFSNLPDRNSGQGLVEQTVIDNYMRENPHVTIEVEALAEEPHKNKLKAYMSSNEPIDITMVHFGAELATLATAGYISELDPEDYAGEEYNFLPGVFEGFTFDGKLYGLPRNSDYMVIYYNKALFEEHNIEVPTTIEELVDAAKAFREVGVEPISMFGKELWGMAVMYQNIAQRISGYQDIILDAARGQKKFSDEPSLLEAAELFQQMIEDGIYNTAYMTMDYGASQNLFTQGRAAMWYMGSWEAGMATNENLPEEFRNNLGVLRFPALSDGKGLDTDLIAWNGGGYALVEASKNKEEAKNFFDYLMRADQWAKIAWETGAAVPAQHFELAGDESEVQVALTDVLLNATSASGMLFNDASSAAFKDAAQTAIGKLAAGVVTPEEFLAELDQAAANP